MTEYTAKEVFAEANRHGDHVADMLTAYAERIAADESAKGRIDFNGMWNAMSDRSDAPLPARAAQVAQGEAVAKVRHFDYRGIARNDFSQEAQMLDGAPVLPDGTLLYTAPPAQPVERGANGLTAGVLGGWCNLLTHAWMYVQEESTHNAWLAIEQIEKEMRDWQRKLATTPSRGESNPSAQQADR